MSDVHRSRDRSDPDAVRPSSASSRRTTTATGSPRTRRATRRRARAGAGLHRGLRAPPARDQPALPGRCPARSGGSLFRIYRDTRFSKDKTPYKTAAGIHFRHERAKDVACARLLPAPGAAATCSRAAASGTPTRRPLTAIREAIVADPDGWREATAGSSWPRNALKRVPTGFDKRPSVRRGSQAQGLRRLRAA